MYCSAEEYTVIFTYVEKRKRGRRYNKGWGGSHWRSRRGGRSSSREKKKERGREKKNKKKKKICCASSHSET